MPVLLEFHEVFKPQSAVEIGGGYFSTSAMLNAKRLWTMEPSEEWIGRMREHFGQHDNWFLMPFHSIGNVREKLDDHGPFDLILVDGADRAPALHWALEHGKTVILHDAQWTWSHDWKLKPGWHRIDFKQWPVMYDHPEAGTADQRPWTSVFTNNPEVHLHFEVWASKEPALYDKFPYPYGLEIPSE